MKTNFLYFRENGYQKYTATAAQTDFVINGDANWDPTITGDTEVKVSITSLAANTGNRGTEYADADTVAGEVTVITDDGKSLSTNDIVIAETTTATVGAANGYDIKVGDVVTIELIPVAGTEACFRADKLRSVHSNSDVATEVTFEASDGSTADDTVVLTHADDDGVAFKKIAAYFQSAAAGSFKSRGGVSVAWDKQNAANGELEAAGVTKMLLAIA